MFLGRVVLIGLLGISSVLAQPGSVTFRRLTIEDGLSQSIVHCIYQDRQGFMWFGTQDGLNRFDGYQFVIFRHDPASAHSLSSNWVNDIQGYDDRIVVATFGGGLNIYEPLDATFRSYRNDPSDSLSLPHDDVKKLYRDRRGVLWVATGGGLRQANLSQGMFRFPDFPASASPLRNIPIQTVYEPSNGELWVGTQNAGLFVIFADRKNCRQYTVESGQLASNQITDILEDSRGRIWVATRQGLYRYESDSDRFILQAGHMATERIQTLFQDHENILWIGTEGDGLTIAKEGPQGLTFRKMVNDPGNSMSLGENRVWRFFEDQSDVLWVGTGGGLSILDRKPPKFISYRHENFNPGSLSNDHVWSILEDSDGELWVGTNNGLNRLDRMSGRFAHFFNNPHDPNTLSDNRIWALAEGSDGSLWCGTPGNGLNRFDRRTFRVRHYRHDARNPASLSHDAVKAIVPASPGRFWIGTRGGGVNYFDSESGTFERFVHYPADTASLSHNDVYCVYVDRSGTLWVGTAGGGLNRLNSDRRTFTRYRHQPDNPASISSDRILAIREDSRSDLWIATNEGLNRMDPRTGIFQRYYSVNGLANNVVYGILVDSTGNLWLSTNDGASKLIFTPDGIKFRNYDRSDGLQSNEFNGGAYFQSPSGEMFFGGVSGFTSFFPEKVVDNPYQPPIVLTGFKIFDRVQPLGCIDPVEGLRLSHRENFFSFEFAALDYTSPRHNQYAYKLDGFDEEWIFAGTRRFVTYTNLDGGKYVFRVRASNNNGVWNDEGISVPITIVPAFWNTWIFRIAIVVMLALTVFLFYRQRIRAERRRNEILEQKVAERTQTLQEMNARIMEADRLKSEFLANMSHELRTPLNAIIGFSELLLEDIRDTGTPDQVESLIDIHSSGKHLLQLINDILDLSKIESGRMELYPDVFYLSELLISVRHTMLPLLEKKKQLLLWELLPDMPPLYGDASRIKQVLINLVSNANKFSGEETTILIRAGVWETDSTKVFVAVSDEGPGIALHNQELIFDQFRQIDGSSTREGQGTGLGLALCRQLIQLHGGHIWVESEEKKGSTFIFTLPIHRHPEPHPHSDWTDRLKSDATILVVEDDVQSYHLLRRYLEGAGFQTQHIPTGNGVLDEARRLKPLAITLDVMLPGKDGWEVLQELKSDPVTCGIPVFVISIVDNKELAYRLNADDYFVKPIDRHQFIERMRGLVESSPLPVRQILVVEDDEQSIDLIRLLLEQENFKILSGRNGLEGLAVLQETKPDLIILDLMMPRMNGFQMLDEVRQHEQWKHIPVIVLTAKDLTSEERELLSTHVRSVMHKTSYHMKDLLAEVIRLTRQQLKST
jgi:signal transduction histidine kinase/ligand-binding sensor domain-containing protein/DNA-binding response OmpR family regulator